MREELQEKVIYLYMISGLKDGAYRCAKGLCLETNSVKFSVLSVLISFAKSIDR